ncbi:MAG: hypothetical protein M9939_26710 [Mesorhizobium sp.]|nr:hypothetical protein [Mesorhizobium sp.]MCO5085137.1 hypothetical protein [Rhizobiaceae bacterium]MCO5164686.1 hypothetical protein [Mesorhizobium sp.]
MNIGDIALRFIRAAEVERASREHVGPSPLRAQQLPYVHSFADKAGWRKEPGDKLERGADPLAEERKAFWERMGMMPTAEELRDLDGLYDLLMMVDRDEERRALLAWARSKVGGKAFRRWCFQVEGIHPETGRRRKDRALTRISAHLNGNTVQNCASDPAAMLQCGPVSGDVSGTLDEDAGSRTGLNSWMADGALASVVSEAVDFSWAQKRWQMRRRREAEKAKKQAAAETCQAKNSGQNPEISRTNAGKMATGPIPSKSRATRNRPSRA